MCSKSFTRFLGFALIPLAVCCILANVLLYFPNGETKYAKEGHLTKYVWFFMGIAGGGLVMILPVMVFMNLEKCAECCASDGSAMCSSVLAALVGLVGSGYCFVISALALMEGPLCDASGGWHSPFINGSGEYLFNRSSWLWCSSPANVVEWNVTLFSILLGLSALESIICAVQVVNGLVAAVCRTFLERGETKIGHVYKKAVYQQYSDATFKHLIDKPQWLGFLGPVISAEEGDTVIVHLKNMATRPYTLHAHGMNYNKTNEGALYPDDTGKEEKHDDRVNPGKSHTYIWQLSSQHAPTKDDSNCLTRTHGIFMVTRLQTTCMC
ncbi:hypothetical protein JZ751_025102 [Albula glossodonta]|uniref:Plastocyanin-like domain-containing protein n=1 Tax=Albula glossodonta TaxID=121402 RepID=A0A8T2PJ79_9TELE|nr:hypothetical protein JZ751_025102 [Albula glossodonta]